MARESRAGSYGPTAVGLMALHDREFFARLLEDPRRAMQDMVKAGKLQIEPADVETVVELIRVRAETYPGEDALALWDRYRMGGQWRDIDWPAGWPPAMSPDLGRRR